MHARMHRKVCVNKVHGRRQDCAGSLIVYQLVSAWQLAHHMALQWPSYVGAVCAFSLGAEPQVLIYSELRGTP